MKNWFLTTMLSVVAVLGCTIESEASGGLFRRRGGCCPDECGSAVAPCTSGPSIAPCEPTARTVEYVERTVTRYRQVMVEKDVEQIVCKQVPRVEKYSYDVQVPKTYPEKRKVTEYNTVSKEVEYTYTVIVPVITPEKRKRTVYSTVSKEVEYTYTVCVPVMTPEKRTETYYQTVSKEVDYPYTVAVPKTMQKVVQQTSYKCVTEEVTDVVRVCRTVAVSYIDECGCCRVRCERVAEDVPVTRCVVRRVPVTTDVTVNYTVCEYETRVGKRTVCELVPATREVTVNVCRYENQSRVGKRTVCEVVSSEEEYTVNVCSTVEQIRKGKKIVCEVVPVEKEITVNVTKYETEKREGSRTVYDTIQERVVRKVQVCVTEPYEETIRVPGCATAECDADCCGRGGLVGRRRGCR